MRIVTVSEAENGFVVSFFPGGEGQRGYNYIAQDVRDVLGVVATLFEPLEEVAEEIN